MSITENKDGQRIITKQADTHIHRTLFFKLFSNFFKKNNNFKPTIFLDSSSEDDGMEINEEESYSNNVHQQEHIHRVIYSYIFINFKFVIFLLIPCIYIRFFTFFLENQSITDSNFDCFKYQLRLFNSGWI